MENLKPDLSKFDNSWYNHGSLFKRVLWMLSSALFFRHSLPFGSGIKRFILKLFGAKMGHGVVIKPSVNIKYPWLLEVGDYTWIGENTWIDNLAKVTIGSHCCLSQGAMLLTGNHNYKKVAFDLMIGEIKIGDGAWVGAQTVVCPGVTCHEGSVLSVGSMAVSDLEPFTIYQGNPAVTVRKRTLDA